MSSAPAALCDALADRYRLERELGQGGMATVYLAHDLRHDRRVAVKVLRPELAAVIGGERFLAEIKTTANLQHPHILPLFDSGRVDGTVFYVMPFVEGESLRDRLGRERQLPIPEAVRIAREVASALDYAHRHAVIHRDVKPENILLHDGQALVADFGIALAASRADGTGRLTETGMSLGTPYYMSPEQALGERTIDARTDIYALGCVLYEMLVGEPPFTGASAQAVLAKVMTERPEAPSVTRDTVPAGIEAAVLTALAKLPVDRFPTAAAFADALAKPDDRPAIRAPSRPIARIVAVTAVVALVAGALGGRFLAPRPAPALDAEPRRYSIVLPDSAPLAINGATEYGLTRSLAAAPDGRVLVYLADTRVGRHLRLLRLDGGASSDLPGTDDATVPTFSPDGRHIAFLAGSEVRRLSLDDHAMSRLGQIPDGRTFSGLYWDADGRIYVLSSESGCLESFSATGGSDTPVGAPCEVQAVANRVTGTEWLLAHGGRTLLGISTKAARNEPKPVTLASEGRPRPVGGTNPLFVPGGYLAFVRDSTVLAASLDPASLTLRADPRELFTGIRREATSGQVQWSLTETGTLVWAAGGDRGLGRLVFVDRNGAITDTVPGPPSLFGSLALSRDGKRIAVERREEGAGSHLAVIDLERHVEDPIPAPGLPQVARWLSSGRGLMVDNWKKAYSDLRRPLGTGVVSSAGRIEVDPADSTLLDESPDRTLRCRREGGGPSVFLSHAGSSDKGVRLDSSATECSFSPDGAWLLWWNESGAYLAPVTARGPEARIRIADAGGTEARWSHDSREVIVHRQAHRLPAGIDPRTWYSIRIPTRPGEQPGPPRVLFSRQANDADGPTSDVAPDGRVLMIQGPPPAVVTRLEVMTNFPAFVAAKLKAATR
jgi:serine/threonine-protein kinase